MSKADPATHRVTQYHLKADGNSITLQDPQNPNRLEGGLTVSPEQIEVFSKGNSYQVNMGPEGVTVSNKARSNRRYEMVLSTPLQPEAYRSTGLSVAFALMGLPLHPELLKGGELPAEAPPLNFQVSVAGSQASLSNYQVRQEADQIIVSDPRERMYRGSMDVSQPDQVLLFADHRQYRIQMSPEGVVVDNPKSDGMRGGMRDLVLTTPLRPEEYRRTGLSVAFSLLGLPLPPHLVGQASSLIG